MAYLIRCFLIAELLAVELNWCSIITITPKVVFVHLNTLKMDVSV